MTTRIRGGLVALAATSLLACLVATTSANDVSVNEQRWDKKWTNATWVTASAIIECPLTLQGSFHNRTFAKVSESLLGHITRAIVRGGAGAGECTGGTVSLLTETLPWHDTYAGFSGSLPDIIRFYHRGISLSASVDPAGLLPSCLMRTTTANPLAQWMELDSDGDVSNVALGEESEIPLTGGGGLCAFGGEGHMSGIGVMTRLGSSSLITVFLI